MAVRSLARPPFSGMSAVQTGTSRSLLVRILPVPEWIGRTLSTLPLCVTVSARHDPQARWVPRGRRAADALTQAEPSRGHSPLTDLLKGTVILVDEDGHP
eukprot:8961286-Pyramimonas_sp.AAC.1